MSFFYAKYLKIAVSTTCQLGLYILNLNLMPLTSLKVMTENAEECTGIPIKLRFLLNPIN
jgi:hypothetical protein